MERPAMGKVSVSLGVGISAVSLVCYFLLRARKLVRQPKRAGGDGCAEMAVVGFQIQDTVLALLVDRVTPLAHVWWLWHMGCPRLDEDTWSLHIAGLVRAADTDITVADLGRLEHVELTTVAECAGSPTQPTKPVRRVACVTWGGVRLVDVLALAGGVAPEATFLWSYGADHGEYNGVHNPCYLKDLPIEFIDRAILATHINGEKLSARRGGPVRLVVPGFYGTNSTKWLVRLELRAMRAPGYFTTALYVDPVIDDGGKIQHRPVWHIAPHAVVVSHSHGSVVADRETVWGWTWGYDEIATVDVSFDGGVHWQLVDLEPRPAGELSWQRWITEWCPVPTGEHGGMAEIRCRATDCKVEMQPVCAARNEVHSVMVTVEGRVASA